MELSNKNENVKEEAKEEVKKGEKGSKKEEIIGEIQKEIRKSICDWKRDKDVTVKNALLVFSRSLICLINKHSETEDGKRLVDQAFNTLNKEVQDKIECIRVKKRVSSVVIQLDGPPIVYLKYFPTLKEDQYLNTKEVDCYNNELTELYLPNVTKVHCSYNQLKKLTLPNAIEVNCCNNQLRELTETNLPKVKEIDCSFNQLINLDLPNVEYVNCSCNQLKELTLPNAKYVRCFRNRITELNCLKAEEVDCSYNKLEKLILPNAKKVECRNNYLKKRSLKASKALKLIGLDLQENDIKKISKKARELIKILEDFSEGKEASNEKRSKLIKYFGIDYVHSRREENEKLEFVFQVDGFESESDSESEDDSDSDENKDFWLEDEELKRKERALPKIKPLKVIKWKSDKDLEKEKILVAEYEKIFKKRIIKELQSEIKNSICDWKKDNETTIRNGKLKFNDNLIKLINKHSKTQEGKRLVDKAFNTLNRETECIEYIESIGSTNLKLKYFPILTEDSYSSLRAVNCQNNDLTELILPSGDKDTGIELVYCKNNNLKKGRNFKVPKDCLVSGLNLQKKDIERITEEVKGMIGLFFKESRKESCKESCKIPDYVYNLYEASEEEPRMVLETCGVNALSSDSETSESEDERDGEDEIEEEGEKETEEEKERLKELRRLERKKMRIRKIHEQEEEEKELREIERVFAKESEKAINRVTKEIQSEIQNSLRSLNKDKNTTTKSYALIFNDNLVKLINKYSEPGKCSSFEKKIINKAFNTLNKEVLNKIEYIEVKGREEIKREVKEETKEGEKKSKEEIEKQTETKKEILKLKYFPILKKENYLNIQTVDCENNQLIELKLDDLPNIKRVWCSNNRIERLELLTAEDVSCENNQLKYLKLPNAETVWCYKNQLTELTEKHLPKVKEIWCGDNQLKTLTLINAETVWCNKNQLKELKRSNLPKAKKVYCNNNKIERLQLPNAESINCNKNQLKELKRSNLPKVKHIECHNNKNLSEESVKLLRKHKVQVIDSQEKEKRERERRLKREEMEKRRGERDGKTKEGELKQREEIKKDLKRLICDWRKDIETRAEDVGPKFRDNLEKLINKYLKTKGEKDLIDQAFSISLDDLEEEIQLSLMERASVESVKNEMRREKESMKRKERTKNVTFDSISKNQFAPPTKPVTTSQKTREIDLDIFEGFTREDEMEKKREVEKKMKEEKEVSKQIIEETQEEIIKKIQEAIKHSICIFKKHGRITIEGGKLEFNDNLVKLINKYSKTEEGQKLVDKAFNTLKKETRNKIEFIKRYEQEKDLKLEYFPILKDGSYPNAKTVDCRWSKVTNLNLPNAEYVFCSYNKLTEARFHNAIEVSCFDSNDLTILEVPYGCKVFGLESQKIKRIEKEKPSQECSLM